MRTASQLTRDCGYVTKLSQLRPRSAYVQSTADEGTRFGKLVQEWLEGREPEAPSALDEPWSWFEYMRQVWTAPPGIQCEVPLGLSWDGNFVEVTEPNPHIYIPAMGSDPSILATAGRADITAPIRAMTVEGLVDAVLVADLKRSAWKYSPPDRHPQLMALGCAFASKIGVEYMVLGLYGAKDGTWEQSDPVRVDDLLPAVLEMCALPENEPRPGPWCAGCYERRNCPAAEGTP